MHENSGYFRLGVRQNSVHFRCRTQRHWRSHLGSNGLHLPVTCVSAPCSSGKTRAACRFIANRIAAAGCTESFVYVAPSKLLIEQVRAELGALGLDVVAITSDTNPRQVIKALLHHLQRFTEGGQVLLVSHQAYFGLPYFPQYGGWRALIDEVPQLDRFFTLAEPRDVALLISHLEPGPLITPWVAQLSLERSSGCHSFDNTGDVGLGDCIEAQGFEEG